MTVTMLSVVEKIFRVLLEKCPPLLCILISWRFRRGESTRFRLKMLSETLLISVSL